MNPYHDPWFPEYKHRDPGNLGDLRSITIKAFSGKNKLRFVFFSRIECSRPEDQFGHIAPVSVHVMLRVPHSIYTQLCP
jgi:hypothetical protein